MARTYTIRIAYTEVANASVTYEVPEGYRLVVRNLLTRCDVAADTWVSVGVHGVNAIFHFFQVPYEVFLLETRAVAYERETVTLLTGPQAVYAIVSGYLFQDPVGRPPETKPLPPTYPRPPSIQPVDAA